MNKHILLIEDNDAMRENIAEILELAGYKVQTAPNGKEGIAQVQKQKPDLIICDIMMPELDGYGVLHLLSRQEEFASIPFIFLTAKADRNDFRKGMEMGADDYITKPFDDIELLNAIESRLRKAALVQKQYTRDINGFEAFLQEVKDLTDLKKIAEEKTVKYYKKKEVIYQEANYPRGVYMIASGKVKTFKTNDLGKEFITGLYTEGDFFGYLSLLENTVYADNAVALEEAEIYLLPKEDFYSLVYRNADIAKKFLQLLCNNLKEKEEQLIKLAYNSVRKKVAEALLTLHNKFNTQNMQPFSMQIAREDLANIAGTATESTIRTLSDFKDEKLIEIQGSKITFVNIEKLQQMKN